MSPETVIRGYLIGVMGVVQATRETWTAEQEGQIRREVGWLDLAVRGYADVDHPPWEAEVVTLPRLWRE